MLRSMVRSSRGFARERKDRPPRSIERSAPRLHLAESMPLLVLGGVCLSLAAYLTLTHSATTFGRYRLWPVLAMIGGISLGGGLASSLAKWPEDEAEERDTRAVGPDEVVISRREWEAYQRAMMDPVRAKAPPSRLPETTVPAAPFLGPVMPRASGAVPAPGPSREAPRSAPRPSRQAEEPAKRVPPAVVSPDIPAGLPPPAPMASPAQILARRLAAQAQRENARQGPSSRSEPRAQEDTTRAASRDELRRAALAVTPPSASPTSPSGPDSASQPTVVGRAETPAEAPRSSPSPPALSTGSPSTAIAQPVVAKPTARGTPPAATAPASAIPEPAEPTATAGTDNAQTAPPIVGQPSARRVAAAGLSPSPGMPSSAEELELLLAGLINQAPEAVRVDGEKGVPAPQSQQTIGSDPHGPDNTPSPPTPRTDDSSAVAARVETGLEAGPPADQEIEQEFDKLLAELSPRKPAPSGSGGSPCVSCDRPVASPHASCGACGNPLCRDCETSAEREGTPGLCPTCALLEQYSRPRR